MDPKSRKNLQILWGRIFGIPSKISRHADEEGIIRLDKYGKPVLNRVACGDKTAIKWMEEVIEENKPKFFFGKKRKKR